MVCIIIQNCNCIQPLLQVGISYYILFIYIYLSRKLNIYLFKFYCRNLNLHQFAMSSVLVDKLFFNLYQAECTITAQKKCKLRFQKYAVSNPFFSCINSTIYSNIYQHYICINYTVNGSLFLVTLSNILGLQTCSRSVMRFSKLH